MHLRYKLFIGLSLAMIGLMTACRSDTVTPTDTVPAQTEGQSGGNNSGDVADAINVTGAWIRPVVVPLDETGGTDEAPLSNPARGERSSQNTAATNAVTALYMVIENRRPEDDALIGVVVSPDIARTAVIHQTIVENDVARMQETVALTVPAGGSVTLEPGGYHVMVMGVQRDLSVGDEVQVTLVFQSGRIAEATATVRESAP